MPRSRTGGASRRRYRIFYVLAGQTEGRCELDQDAPISVEDLDGIERTLMGRLGCGNALVVGWQELDRRESPH